MGNGAMMPAILIALATLLSWPALAQAPAQPPEQPRCWLGSTGYSPGATMRAGSAVLVCTPAFTWEPTMGPAGGCLHGGDFYSVGAIQNASNQQQRLTQCQPDGTWTALPAPALR
jgi:hypothetical protein